MRKPADLDSDCDPWSQHHDKIKIKISMYKETKIYKPVETNDDKCIFQLSYTRLPSSNIVDKEPDHSKQG